MGNLCVMKSCFLSISTSFCENGAKFCCSEQNVFFTHFVSKSFYNKLLCQCVGMKLDTDIGILYINTTVCLNTTFFCYAF